jgi:hypothetical protein
MLAPVPGAAGPANRGRCRTIPIPISTLVLARGAALSPNFVHCRFGLGTQPSSNEMMRDHRNASRRLTKARAAALGIPVDLDVEKDNPGARRLYDRPGFVQVGETEQEDRLRWEPSARRDRIP